MITELLWQSGEHEHAPARLPRPRPQQRVGKQVGRGSGQLRTLTSSCGLLGSCGPDQLELEAGS